MRADILDCLHAAHTGINGFEKKAVAEIDNMVRWASEVGFMFDHYNCSHFLYLGCERYYM